MSNETYKPITLKKDLCAASADIPPTQESIKNSVYQWENFGQVQKAVFPHVINHLDSISNLTETRVLELSEQFQFLAQNSKAQTDYLQEILHLAQTVQINKDTIQLTEVTQLMQNTFVNSINCILNMSKQAISMVYILDEGIKILRLIEKSIREIEVINHKTKYLSLNATIEAVRAGEAGESFQVVASEVRELSNDTQRLATNIREQVNQMTQTLDYAQNMLKAIASLDMNENLLAKDKLDDMMNSLVENSQKMSGIVQKATVTTNDFSQKAQNLILSIQFQDRIKQDITKVTSDLKKIEATIDTLCENNIFYKVSLNSEANEDVLFNFQSVKSGPVSTDELDPKYKAAQESNDIELF